MVLTARPPRRVGAAHGQPVASPLSALAVVGALFLTVVAFTAVGAASSSSPLTRPPAADPSESQQDAPPAQGARGWLWFAQRGPVPTAGVLGTITVDASAANHAAGGTMPPPAASSGPGI